MTSITKNLDVFRLSYHDSKPPGHRNSSKILDVTATAVNFCLHPVTRECFDLFRRTVHANPGKKPASYRARQNCAPIDDCFQENHFGTADEPGQNEPVRAEDKTQSHRTPPAYYNLNFEGQLANDGEVCSLRVDFLHCRCTCQSALDLSDYVTPILTVTFSTTST